MSPRKRPPVERLAGAIGEGSAVDWRKEKASRPELRRTLESLEVVEAILRGYRAFSEPSASQDPAETLSRTATSSPARRDAKEIARAPASSLFTWGPLQAVERIGAGSFGEVYRAWDPSLERDVALKLWKGAIPDDDSVERFLREARRLARVRHDNVLVVHGADRHDGRPGMWTDLVDGQSLEKLLELQGPLGAREAGLIGMELCRALAAVHAAGLVHRDVKTSNVMRRRGGGIVLMDFGAVGELTASGAVRSEDGALGTPLALAPEQLHGAPATTAGDIYSLGVLIYRLLTQAYPVDARTMEELRAKHARGARVPLRERRADLSTRFVQAVERAIDPSPANRYASPAAMESSLALAIDLAPRTASRRGIAKTADLSDTKARARRSLPEALSRFVDRGDELAACAALLESRRWLTLTGPIGCGKTRLALRLAETSADAFADGVWFVDLGSLSIPERVAHAIVSAIGIREKNGESPGDALVARFRAARALLVLDRCDRVAEGVASLADGLLGACAELRLIATSVEPIGGTDEQPYEIAPLGAEAFASAHATNGVVDDRVEAAGVATIARGAELPERSPFVGREKELALLVAALERAQARTGSVILLGGEAGLGKTRLMDEFRRHAESRGALCLEGRCAFRGGRNFGPFVEALEECARRIALPEGGKASASELGQPTLRALFSTLGKLLDPSQRARAGPTNREQVWHLLDALLKRIARYDTLALFVEDLHWADEGTLSLLNHVARNLGDSRLMIVGSYRPEEDPGGDGHRPLDDVIRLLGPVPSFERVLLEPLDRNETLTLLERLLDDPGLGRAWGPVTHERSQGNPFFAIEIVRFLVSSGARGDRARAGESPMPAALPQTVRDVLMRRLGRLSAEERDLLDVAAVEGEDFHADTLETATGLSRIQLLKRLQTLEREHRLIVATAEGHRFAHGLIQELLLLEIPAELRREYHAAVAAHLVRRHHDRPDYAGRIGHQLFEAHRFGEALPFLTRAARDARRLFLNDRALYFLDCALEARGRTPEPGMSRAQILRAKCRVLLLLGRPEAARAAAEAALGEEVRAANTLGIASSREWIGEAALAQGDLSTAETFLTEAMDAYAKLGDARLVARCDHKVGAAATRRGDFDQALARLTRALERLGEGDEQEIARIRLDIGDVLSMRGEYDRAVETFETAVAALRRMDARNDLARGLNQLGNALFQSGKTEQALSHYEEAVVQTQELGDLQGMARLKANLGNVHLVRGDSERALRSYHDALALFEEIGDKLGVGKTLFAIGNGFFTRGDFDEAARHYQRSLGPRREIGDRWGLANSLDNLGVVEYHLARFASALAHSQSALTHRAELGDRVGRVETSLNLAAVESVLGNVEAARMRLEEALAIATELGDLRRRARVLLAKACLRHWAGDRDATLSLVDAVHELAIDDPAIGSRLLLLDGLARSMDAPERAEATLREASCEAARAGSISERASVHLALADVNVRLDRRDEAARQIDAAMELIARRMPLLELHALRLRAKITGHAGRGDRGRDEPRVRKLVEILASGVPEGMPAPDFASGRFPLP